MDIRILANKKKEDFDFQEVEFTELFEKVPNERLYPLLELMLKELKADQSNEERIRNENC